MKAILYLGCLALLSFLTKDKVLAQETIVVGAKNVIKLYPAKIIYPRAELAIYPNPAAREVELILEGVVESDGRDKFILTVSDKQGFQLAGKEWNGEKIDVSAFPAGIYIVTLKRKQEVYSQKLIVNRE